MARRIDLQTTLEKFLGSRNVYYQPPETIKMEYPAIVYSKSNIRSRFANDAAYSYLIRYEVIVIDRRPDNLVIDKLLTLPYCTHDRTYKADNLNHDVLTVYY